MRDSSTRDRLPGCGEVLMDLDKSDKDTQLTPGGARDRKDRGDDSKLLNNCRNCGHPARFYH